jgi:hypothetical protein
VKEFDSDRRTGSALQPQCNQGQVCIVRTRRAARDDRLERARTAALGGIAIAATRARGRPSRKQLAGSTSSHVPDGCPQVWVAAREHDLLRVGHAHVVFTEPELLPGRALADLRVRRRANRLAIFRASRDWPRSVETAPSVPRWCAVQILQGLINRLAGSIGCPACCRVSASQGSGHTSPDAAATDDAIRLLNGRGSGLTALSIVEGISATASS